MSMAMKVRMLLAAIAKACDAEIEDSFNLNDSKKVI